MAEQLPNNNDTKPNNHSNHNTNFKIFQTGWCMMKNKNIPLYIFASLLLVLFVLGLGKVYEKGFVEGGRTLCESNDLNLGIDKDGNYVCYDPLLQEQNFNNPWMGELP